MHHHERVDVVFVRVRHERVGNLVLNVARADAGHPFVECVALQFDDVIFGEARQRFAVVQLQLLHHAQSCVLRRVQPRQHGPHGRHLDRVRSDVLAENAIDVEILLVNPHLVLQPRHVRHVDLHRSIS